MHAAHSQAKALFGKALALAAAEERAAYLEQACGGDAALRAEVDSLLATLEGAGDLLHQPAAALGATVDSDLGEPDRAHAPAETVGSRIGPYKLLQQLGSGGMGAVWVAEQTEPVKRRVALKLIKPGMDSEQVLRRFEAERQALALMDHTHIAKVFDAGTTPTGRPYFVMELVKGVPITKYCDALHLPIRERLALFVPVCQAIQHAHQKGIIHRDIKPSNVLVAMQDGQPVAKVIDFGVAKALHQRLTEQSLYTEIGQIIGTLEYMSPEQAELSALDIDTRADVYGLGVLLYELLTGSTPLDRKRLKNAAVLEVLRRIREEEPPRPSTRLTDAKESLPSLAAQRRTEPARLTKEVRGELDWIVMKALEKDRTRRYETANGLARDVERYLHDEAVEACPPSAKYRLKKLLRRHKGPVVAAAAVFLVLLVGVALSTWQAVRASRAEAEAQQQRDEAVLARHAEAQQRQAAVAARDAKEQARAEAAANERKAKAAAKAEAQQRLAAEAEKRTAQAVRDFLQHDLLRQADAGAQAEQLRTLGGSGFAVQENPTIKELLERAAAGLTPARIEEKFPRQPLVQAEILQTVGSTYRGVGAYARAITHLQRAADLRRTHLGPDHPDTLTTLNNLAGAYRAAGRTAAAIALYEQVRDARLTKLGPDHPSTLTTLNNLAEAYRTIGRTAAAIALHEQVRDVRLTRLGPDHPHTLITFHNLAVAYQAAGKTAAAIALYEKVRDARLIKLGPDHPGTLTTLNNLAEAYRTLGKTAAAIALHEQVRDAKLTKFGPDHPSTLTTLNNLALAYRAAGQTVAAIALFEKVRDARLTKFGPEHPSTLTTLNNLAVAYRVAGKAAAAIPLLEQVRDALLTRLGPDHPSTLTTLHNLAAAYQAAGKRATAIQLWEQLLPKGRRAFGISHPNTIAFTNSLVSALEQTSQFARASAVQAELLTVLRLQLPPDDLRLAGTLAQHGRTLLKAGKPAAAEPILRECLSIRAKKDPEAWTTFHTRSLLGGSLLGQKQYADAAPLLLAGYEGLKQHEGKIPPQSKVRLSEALAWLVQLYEDTGKKEKADDWRKQLEAAKSRDHESKK